MKEIVKGIQELRVYLSDFSFLLISSSVFFKLHPILNQKGKIELKNKKKSINKLYIKWISILNLSFWKYTCTYEYEEEK